MSIDSKIIEAIEAAVAQNGQSPALAIKIVAWLQAVSSGNETLDEFHATERHLELLYDATPTGPEKETLF